MLDKLPIQLRLIIAGLLSKMSKEEQTELFDDIKLFFISVQNRDANTVLNILVKYRIDEIYKNNFE